MKRIQVYNINKRSFFWYRVLPGTLTIILVTSPVWTSLLGIYDLLLIYLGFTATYVLYKSVQMTIANIIGIRKISIDSKRNWSKQLKTLDFKTLPDQTNLPANLNQVYHLIFYPIYKEPYELIKSSFQSIINQDYPHPQNIIIVAAVEERAGQEQKKLIRKIISEFKDSPVQIWEIYHPDNLPNEIRGDACSNLRWAARMASKELVRRKIDSKNVIFTKADSDTRFGPKHISALTYKYLTSEKRLNKYFGPAILIYSNNYWDVPALVRVFSSALTVGVLEEWVAEKHKKQSFSCYSANFRLLEKINYWDATTGAEDTYFYWNAFLHLHGDFTGEPFYLPVTMDAVQGKTFVTSHTSLYKQQLRWGWGALIMPLAIQGMMWNRKIKLGKKLEKIGVLFRAYNVTLTMSTLLTFSIPVLTLLNKELEYSSITYMLPQIISYMLTTSILFQIPHKYFIWKFYGSPPKEKSLFFKFWWWIIEPFTIFFHIWTYYFLPRLQAQYELTLNKQRKKFFISVEGRVGEKSKTKSGN